LTERDDINVGGCLKLGRGENNKNVIPTGNENARQKQPFRLGTSCRPRFIASFYPDSSKDLLATSRSLNNNRRRYLRTEKGRVKFATLPYPFMNAKDKENSIETSSPHQKRSRTAHLQLPSIARMRASTDRRFAVPRGSKAVEKVISAPLPAARHRARALTTDSRSITTATVHDRRAAVSSNENVESISVSVDKTIQSINNIPPEKPIHAEPRKFHPQRQDPQIKAATCRHR